MESPDRSRSYAKRDVEDDPVDICDDDREGYEKRKHKSTNSRKLGNAEESDGTDSSGRKRSISEKYDSRRGSDGSKRAGSDEDDHVVRKDSRSKLVRKKQEENTLEKLGSWYQDAEAEAKHDSGQKTGGTGPARPGESDRRRSISKFSDHEGSQVRIRGDDEMLHHVDSENVPERDLGNSDRRENREKGHGSSEQRKSTRKRWDEPDAFGKSDETSLVEKSDLRSGRHVDYVYEGAKDSNREKDVEDKDERRDDSERIKRGRPGASFSDVSALKGEDRLSKDGTEEHKQSRNLNDQDISDSHARNLSADEGGNTWSRDKTKREMESSSRSRIPERSGRRHYESQNYELDYDRSPTVRRKELEKDGFSDKGDDGWSTRNKDRDSSRDSWRRRQGSIDDKERRDVDTPYDYGREWEPPRRWSDNQRARSGGRKDRDTRTEAIKTSSKYGISNENYDVIEIQTKPFEYSRDEPRNNEVGQRSDDQFHNDEKSAYTRDERSRSTFPSDKSSEDFKDRFMDVGPSMQDQPFWRDDTESSVAKTKGLKTDMANRATGGQSSSSGSQPPYGPQGTKGIRGGRGLRGRPIGRDSPQVGLAMPMVGSQFGPLGMPPPGAMQSMAPNMSPAPGPPISPNVFVPPFSPVIWPGARGMDMNLLAGPPSFSPIPPVPPGPRFPTNIGTPPNPGLYFGQPGPVRGPPQNISGPTFSPTVPVGSGQPQDKTTSSWVPSRISGPPGKAPSRGEQNDYSQNFVDTGMRPQNFIRELDLTSVVEDYPRLRELLQRKDEIVTKSASPPMYYKCDLREQELSPEFFGTKFDVILIDPPWEEYVHRAPGVTDHLEYWTFEEIMNLKIEAIADTPSFIFLWVGDGVGLEQGRQCFKKWGFRRCEDICWVKTNKTNATPGLRHDSHTLFQRSKEHCLMGIKGTVRRSTDGHIIHANIDTDVIIAEEPPYGSTAKPEDMYKIIEHFALGRRRLELFGEDHNIRSGWLTVGKGLSSSNFNAETYLRGFGDKDGKVWQGGGGRNPPPEASHLVVTTPEIEALRPKSPMKNQHQLQQQQSVSISLTAASSTNKMPAVNSPQNPNIAGLNQEASSSNISNIPSWAPPMENFRDREGGPGPPDGRSFGMYGYNSPFVQGSGEF